MSIKFVLDHFEVNRDSCEKLIERIKLTDVESLGLDSDQLERIKLVCQETFVPHAPSEYHSPAEAAAYKTIEQPVAGIQPPIESKTISELTDLKRQEIAKNRVVINNLEQLDSSF